MAARARGAGAARGGDGAVATAASDRAGLLLAIVNTAGCLLIAKNRFSAAALGNWQVGKTMPVRFDPANPTQVTIG
mgnify:CR=1 FL=1